MRAHVTQSVIVPLTTTWNRAQGRMYRNTYMVNAISRKCNDFFYYKMLLVRLLGLKNKRFVCPSGPKIRGVGRSLWMQKKCNTIHVCAFLGMQSLKIKVNPGVERELHVFHYIWLKNLFGTLIKNSNILFEHFC